MLNFGIETLGTMQQRSGNWMWPNEAPEAPKTVWCKEASQNFACTVSKDQADVYAGSDAKVKGTGIWGRIGGSTASFDPQTGSAFDQDSWFLQAGIDGLVHETENGAVIAGIYGTYGHSSVDVGVTPDPVTLAGRSGSIDMDGYGVGGHLSWLGDTGFYADGVAQATWYDSDLSTSDLGELTSGNSAFGYALSLETGKRFVVKDGWAFVPQAQLIYSAVDFDSFTDSYGTTVSTGDGASLLGRAGLRVENLSSWKASDGTSRHFQGYGIANLSYEFLDGTSVDVSGTELTQDGQSLWGEIGLGGTYTLKERVSLYGEGSYSTSLEDFGDSNLWKGNAGVRFTW